MGQFKILLPIITHKNEIRLANIIFVHQGNVSNCAYIHILPMQAIFTAIARLPMQGAVQSNRPAASRLRLETL